MQTQLHCKGRGSPAGSTIRWRPCRGPPRSPGRALTGLPGPPPRPRRATAAWVPSAARGRVATVPRSARPGRSRRGAVGSGCGSQRGQDARRRRGIPPSGPGRAGGGRGESGDRGQRTGPLPRTSPASRSHNLATPARGRCRGRRHSGVGRSPDPGTPTPGHRSDSGPAAPPQRTVNDPSGATPTCPSVTPRRSSRSSNSVASTTVRPAADPAPVGPPAAGIARTGGTARRIADTWGECPEGRPGRFARPACRRTAGHRRSRASKQHSRQTGGASVTDRSYSRRCGKTTAGSRPQFGHLGSEDRAGDSGSVGGPVGPRGRALDIRYLALWAERWR